MTVLSFSGQHRTLHIRTGSNGLWREYIHAVVDTLTASPDTELRDALRAVRAHVRPLACTAPPWAWDAIDGALHHAKTFRAGRTHPASPFHTVARVTPTGLLNDLVRRTLRAKLMYTATLASVVEPDRLPALAGSVAEYDGFGVEADPRGDRDFGSFVFDGLTVFFRVCGFDAATFGTGHDRAPHDPSDPITTLHVITLMLRDDL